MVPEQGQERLDDASGLLCEVLSHSHLGCGNHLHGTGDFLNVLHGSHPLLHCTSSATIRLCSDSCHKLQAYQEYSQADLRAVRLHGSLLGLSICFTHTIQLVPKEASACTGAEGCSNTCRTKRVPLCSPGSAEAVASGPATGVPDQKVRYLPYAGPPCLRVPKALLRTGFGRADDPIYSSDTECVRQVAGVPPSKPPGFGASGRGKFPHSRPFLGFWWGFIFSPTCPHAVSAI